MKKDKLRAECEHIFYEKQCHARYDWADVCEFEERFKKFKRKRRVHKAISTALLLSVLACGAIGTTYIAKKLDFKEPVYSAPNYYYPNYYNDFPINVFIDESSFSAKQVETIKQILEKLDNGCVGFKIEIASEYDYSVCNLKISAGDVFEEFGSLVLGSTWGSVIDNDYSEVVINKNLAKLNTKMFYYVTIHEILHALGLEHTKNISSIMFPFMLYHDVKQGEFNALNTLYPTISEEDPAAALSYEEYLALEKESGSQLKHNTLQRAINLEKAAKLQEQKER